MNTEKVTPLGQLVQATRKHPSASDGSSRGGLETHDLGGRCNCGGVTGKLWSREGVAEGSKERMLCLLLR